MLVAPSAGLKAIQLYFLDVETSFIQTLFAQQAKPMCTCVHACSDATCSASKLVLSRLVPQLLSSSRSALAVMHAFTPIFGAGKSS